MDIGEMSAAYGAVKFVQEFLSGVLSAKAEAIAKDKVRVGILSTQWRTLQAMACSQAL